MSHRILAAVAFLCCSLVTYSTPVKPCIALLISAVTGVDNSQTSLCFSEKSLLLVNPPVVFTLHIKTCSIIESDDNPAQNRSERRTTCRPFLKAKNTSGCSSIKGSSVMVNVVCSILHKLSRKKPWYFFKLRTYCCTPFIVLNLVIRATESMLV